MNRKLEFFYDYVSLYSYLANSQLLKIEAEVVYRPMYLGAVLKATGNSAPLTVKAKGRYLQTDVARWVSRYGIAYKMPEVFPQNTVSALRLAIVALRRGCFDAVHQPLFDAIFAHGNNLGEDERIAEIIEAAGLPVAEILDEIKSDSIKEELKKNTEEAISRGAFGAPTFYVGDEMFFGNDRFEFINESLV